MSDTNPTPSPDDAPAVESPAVDSVDAAEKADGHPHTDGLEQPDAASAVDGEEFGEAPDVETHLDEGPGAVDPAI
jgi:hypothetical protein